MATDKVEPVLDSKAVVDSENGTIQPTTVEDGAVEEVTGDNSLLGRYL